MDPFRLTGQAIAFAAVMAVVAVVVGVAAPFGSIALGAVALLAVGVVLIKAMFRTRRWWPLTAVEGTVALSGVVLLIGGVAVAGYSMVRLGTSDGLHMMIGWPSAMSPTRPGSVTRSISYGDPAMQQRLKDALREAGVPWSVKMQDGKEFVTWPAEHNAAAEAVDAKLREGPLPGGRNVHFPDPAQQKQFTDWLAQKGIEHEVVKTDGKDFVVWKDGSRNAVREFLDSRGAADCKGKVAAGKAEAGSC